MKQDYQDEFLILVILLNPENPVKPSIVRR